MPTDVRGHGYCICNRTAGFVNCVRHSWALAPVTGLETLKHAVGFCDCGSADLQALETQTEGRHKQAQ